MKQMKTIICICLIFLISTTTLSIGAGATSPQSDARKPFVQGEVIVGLEEISPESLQAIKLKGGTIIKEIASLNALVVRVPVGKEDEFIQSVKSIFRFKFAERNGIVEAVYTPNDPYWNSYMWNMRITKADKAWDIHKGSTNVVIAIIDTGIDYNHPDLKNHYKSGGYDWVNNDNDPWDDHSHGTHCAGVAAAIMDNNIGVVGMTQCTLWTEKVLNYQGQGDWDDLANGIVHATNNGVNVISMSLGGTDYSNLVESACTYAWNHGVVVVAAAGNNNMNIDSTPFYPASLSTVMAVSATDNNDQKASYSNYGNKVEVAAPGSSVLSTIPGNSYGYMSGTSMACPHVAGLAGLLWSYNSSLTNAELRNRLHTGVDDLGAPGKDIYFGYGRINAYAALTNVSPPPPQRKWQYSFVISPFIDQMHVNVTSQPGGMLIYGIDNLTSPSPAYPAAVLGWATGDNFYMAIDFKTTPGAYELGFIVGKVSTRNGKLYRTTDGTSWVGPDAVTLVPFAEAELSGASAATVDVAPEGWPYTYKFNLSPFIDNAYVHTDPQPDGTLIHGYDTYTNPGPGYPAPILGIAVGNNFYMPIDFKTNPGVYELAFIVGTVSTRNGKLYRTTDGTSWIGPDTVTLVPF
jgi:thermitase